MASDRAGRFDVERIRKALDGTSRELERADETAKSLDAGLRAHRTDVLTRQQEEIRRLKRRLKRAAKSVGRAPQDQRRGER